MGDLTPILWLKVVLCCCAMLVSACATVQSAKRESIVFSLDPAWKLVSSQENEEKQISVMEFVPQGETTSDWTKLITVRNFGKKFFNSSPDRMMNELRERVERSCPGARWQVIERQDDGILYEWKVGDCPPYPPQHEIVRIIEAKDNIWRVAYTAKVGALSGAEREQWIAWLSGITMEMWTPSS